MGKKRLTSCKKVLDKKAQITIFMIVGLVILFVFIFLFQLVNSTQKERLSSEQEKVFTKVFKKEAMRIYVQDCLSDELEEALILIGQQGRIWSDQAGGLKEFSEGINGLENPPGSDNRISYGLAKTQDLPYNNSYPCNNQTNSSPEFCQYKFPENNDGFGELDLKTSTIRNDLRRHLINKTVGCIINYTKTNISNKAEVEIDDLSLGLNIENDGINVNAEFPLKFSLGTEEFFHLSKFDFFYPTQLKWLLESAVVRPLFYDWKYLDFNYTEETLQQQTFNYASTSQTCPGGICTGMLFFDKYSSLGINLRIEEHENGDDIFVFSSPEIINRPGFYQFKIARQNRPPALDYINRSQCLSSGYDYLVIPGDEELGDINITLFSLDPDEDNVTNIFFKVDCTNIENEVKILGHLGTLPPNKLYLDNVTVISMNKDFCNITAIAEDEHGEKDEQITRILIDRPITLGITLELPYPNVSSLVDDHYFISKEDPVYINVTWPEDTLTVPLTDTKINLSYKNNEGTEQFNYTIPNLIITHERSCFSLPWASPYTCDIESYKGEINNFPPNKANNDFNRFKENTSTGILNLTFSEDYCSDLTKEESVSANIIVKECIPYINPERPWAYNPTGKYHQYVYGVTDDNKTDFNNFVEISEEEFNPFLATHSCCKGDIDRPGRWELKDEEEVCFINPELGCYGGQASTTALGNNGHYIQEIQMDTCSGDRGNICGGGGKISELYPSKEAKQMYCGDNNQPGCRGIDSACEGKESWTFVSTDDDFANEAWCHGTMGCSEACTTEVVAEIPMPDYRTHRFNKIFEGLAVSDQDLNMHCGCSFEDFGDPCDSGFNGIFDGTCGKDPENEGEGLTCIRS
jgi:hypothetical protein